MVMRSYSEIYLNEAKQHLGAATDYLVNVCGIAADRVGYVYASNPMMARFSRGDPGVLAGMSGIELGQRLFMELRATDTAPHPEICLSGRSPEYWGGWALAHFQWYWCKSFRWIFVRTSMSKILSRYSIYHEMDILRFLEDFMLELQSVELENNLKRIRLAAGYSQSKLSLVSGVNVRNIQLYEQGVQDINRASASTLAALARPLACSIEDLME